MENIDLNSLTLQFSKVENSLSLIKDISNEANMAIGQIKEIGQGSQRIETLKLEIQRDLYVLDKQFDAFIAKLDSDLEKHKVDAALVMMQLQQYNNQINRMLDYLNNVGPNNDSAALFMINSWSDKITELIFKIL